MNEMRRLAAVLLAFVLGWVCAQAQQKPVQAQVTTPLQTTFQVSGATDKVFYLARTGSILRCEKASQWVCEELIDLAKTAWK